MTAPAAAPLRRRLGKADLPEGTMRGFTLGKDRHVLVANLSGRFFALDDMCNHAGCLLSAGKLAGGVVTCSCHEMAFDVRDGRLLTEPRLCDDQRVVRVTAEGGELWLEVAEQGEVGR